MAVKTERVKINETTLITRERDREREREERERVCVCVKHYRSFINSALQVTFYAMLYKHIRQILLSILSRLFALFLETFITMLNQLIAGFYVGLAIASDVV